MRISSIPLASLLPLYSIGGVFRASPCHVPILRNFYIFSILIKIYVNM
ncbi:hypothetical protein AN403_4225 [Pseudomonas fluorescens]|uniref:Uncharacterized protein n=1 Tax=Pseudomonas fluorescens TaxID=294 RepID=A0A0P8XJQ3_PSEFL|nr:hypothetical protein AN403_4225 [Pseudomonas fluorescens]